MDRLIIENVRCFRGRHEVPLAPLTILVGENSTGKSTLLAMARLAWESAAGTRELDFNEEPFLLGAYDQVATSRSPGDSASQFSFGSQWRGGEVAFRGVFTSQKGQPALSRWWMEGAGYRIEVGYRSQGSVAFLKVNTPSGEMSFDGDDLPEAPTGLSPHWTVSTLGWLLSRDDIADLPFTRKDVGDIDVLSYVPYEFGLRPYAFSPIRTRPRRTYDPVQEIREPEGSHVPMVLANAAFEGGEVWEILRQPLEEFGAQSGLYNGIEVRRPGSSQSDPFQLQFKVGHLLVNLMDIGYGVSQVLPILVDCLRGDRGRTFLLQQPEVHLHPKAQAELGSFLALLAKQEKKKFLIETHSDYLVDRIRMDIRDGKNGLQPEDVSLLYFERAEGTVKIHRLMLDKLGNIENAPPGYRKFILEEERRFLGI